MFLFVFLAGVWCLFGIPGSMRKGMVLVAVILGMYGFDATFPDREFRESTFDGRDNTQQGVGT